MDFYETDSVVPIKPEINPYLALLLFKHHNQPSCPYDLLNQGVPLPRHQATYVDTPKVV